MSINEPLAGLPEHLQLSNMPHPSSMLTRYRIECTELIAGASPCEMISDPQGEWVKFEEVVNAEGASLTVTPVDDTHARYLELKFAQAFFKANP